MVGEGNEKRYPWRSSNNGRRLRRSLGQRWSGHLVNVPPISTKCALKIRHCERKSSRYSRHTGMLMDYRTSLGQSALYRHKRSLRRDLYPGCCCPTDTASSHPLGKAEWASYTALKTCAWAKPSP